MLIGIFSNKLGINFIYRFIPYFVETRRIIASGEIGEVQIVQLEACSHARPGERLTTWRGDPLIAGLGSTMVSGVHAYDILRYLLSSEIETVSTFFDTPCGVMEAANLSILRFANGVIAQVSVHEKVPFPHNDFVIHGSKGRITGKGGRQRAREGGELQVTTADGKTRITEFPVTNVHAASVAAFSEALIEGRDPVPSGMDGLRSVQLTDAMARSAWNGLHVRLAR